MSADHSFSTQSVTHPLYLSLRYLPIHLAVCSSMSQSLTNQWVMVIGGELTVPPDLKLIHRTNVLCLSEPSSDSLGTQTTTQPHPPTRWLSVRHLDCTICWAGLNRT